MLPMTPDSKSPFMTDKDWSAVAPFFTPEENWGDWRKVHKELIFNLLAFRRFVNRPVVILNAYELTGHTGEYHPKGMAADFYVKGMNVVDQFIALTRFDGFNGIGIYPHWRPQGGLHGDIRPKENRFDPDARWIRNKAGNYITLTWENLLKEVKNG